MKIHEYQAKEILAKFGVPTPRGEVVFKKEEARAAAERLGTTVVVVKAQIHAGGRGKAGGVKLAKSADEAAALAEQHAGHEAGDAANGPRRAHRAAPADRGRPRHQARALPEHSGGPRRGRARVHGQHGGRNGNRGSGQGASGSDSARDDSSRQTGFQPYHARKLAFGLGLSPELASVARAVLCSRSTARFSKPTRRCSKSIRAS